MSLENDLLNIRETCEITGLSEMTIRKYLGLGKPPKPSKLPNARKVARDGKEFWEIPLSDLYEAGLMKGRQDPRAMGQAINQISQNLIEQEASLSLRVENEALKKQIELLERNLEDLREEIRFSRRAIETAETQKERRKFWKI